MKQLNNWIDEQLQRLEQAQLMRKPRNMESGVNGCVVLDGKERVNFGSNDYLSLASDARILEAVADTLRANRWGAGASPLVTGRTAIHDELEKRLAAFKGTEAALVFSSGFAANFGTISSIVGKEDEIFSDAKNHASIIDGCRLSGATITIYSHCDPSDIDRKLAQSPSLGRRLVVTDTLFSMDGDVAPLDEICDIANTHNAMVMVDEAHATGVFGDRGRGISEQLNCHDGVDIHVGTLSKAFGSIGGFVAGSQKLIDWLFNRARSYVFSTAPPPAVCAAAIAALDNFRDEPFRRKALLDNAKTFREQLVANRWDIGNSCSQIVPIHLGQPEVAVEWSKKLTEHGFVVPGIRPPTVPQGESMLRVSLNYSHDTATLDRFIQTLNSIRATALPGT